MQIPQKIRYRYIENQVLKIFTKLPAEKRRLPVNMNDIVGLRNDCVITTYQEFSVQFKIPVSKVIKLNESVSGCLHYDPESRHYIIMYNKRACEGRKNWTQAHELGHVFLGHSLMIEGSHIAEDDIYFSRYPLLEKEADYFASILLAPPPVLKALHIHSEDEIRCLCGLSGAAAGYQYESLLRSGNCITSWDHDMIHIFQSFISSYKSKL
ncbi:ImmA/IrrE family metallo-endopeptidase [Sinanaerobacter chloroacetimidivorans]|uniref:ImmA/IrrE family metallo-endopeptidase n=1 Tax=Sinanaerobacter chloroacetimidivorans TaxID=2818044 RepID=A0A8J7W0F0_9FIRM|nr:ImmA/IrrE family metallo-endopeptidase [Sinanaerobacter chloroacetimidivorans]MBR0596955.1 ImmA/IrrE family metallo-endopeptidase [Sinanaerobacter chloroacetimidivorans]